MAEDDARDTPDAIRLATRERPQALDPVPVVEAVVLCLTCNNAATQGNGLCGPCTTGARTRKDILAAAAERLEQNTVVFVNHLLQGSARAAANGDTRPAQWALERTRVVQPAETREAGVRVIVNVGMVLPGLPGAD